MVEQFKTLKGKIKNLLIEIEEGTDNFDKNMNFGLIVL